jgi:hypothetical protein
MPSKLLKKLTTCLSCLTVSLILILSLVASLVITHPQTAHAATLPAYRYTKTFDASASGASATGAGVATDAQGNVYVIGQFNGTVVFDGTGGSDSQTSSGGNFLTKYNANGTYGFTKTFDTSAGGAYARGYGVATDAQGNVYVTGNFGGTVVFDGTGGSDSQTAPSQSSFLTKYNANGSYAYTKTFDTSASGASAAGAGVATDASGNVYVTGQFNGTVVFDGTGGSDSQTSSNQSSFLTKYNANGSYAYTKTFDTSAGANFVGGYGVATDSFGNIYVTGQFSGTVIFDGTGGSDSRTSSNVSSFLTQYKANGTYGFTKTFDTSAGGASAAGAGVATDSFGNIYVTGQFHGTVTFDGTGGSDSRTPGGGNDGSFLTQYKANGTYGFTKTFDTSAGSAYADGNAVATDTLGNAYIAGDFFNTVIFDGPGGSDSRTQANQSSFLTSYQVSLTNQPGSSAPTTVPPSPLPGAPDTGFGVFMTKPLRLLVLYSLAALGVAMLAVWSAKLMKR